MSSGILPLDFLMPTFLCQAALFIVHSFFKVRGHKVTRIVGVEAFMLTSDQVASDCQKR